MLDDGRAELVGEPVGEVIPQRRRLGSLFGTDDRDAAGARVVGEAAALGESCGLAVGSRMRPDGQRQPRPPDLGFAVSFYEGPLMGYPHASTGVEGSPVLT